AAPLCFRQPLSDFWGAVLSGAVDDAPTVGSSIPPAITRPGRTALNSWGIGRGRLSTPPLTQRSREERLAESVSTLRTHPLARKPWPYIAIALGAAGVALWHGLARQLPTDVASPLTIASHLYALMVVAALFWRPGALGMALRSRAGL